MSERSEQREQGATQHAGATAAATSDEHAPARAGAGASKGRDKGGEPPLGYNRNSFAKPPDIDTISPNFARVYTEEERAAYADKKRQENYERAAIARRWIAEDAIERDKDKTRRNLPSVCTCGSAVSHKAGEIYINAEGVIYHDRRRCGQWTCPVCAVRNAYERAADIEAAIIEGHRRGYSMLFITFTIPHNARQSCATVSENIQAAYTKMKRGHRFNDWLESLGYVSQIRTTDYTYTPNGWHVHFHCVYFFDGSRDLMELAAAVASPSDGLPYFWDRSVYRETGRHISFRHGLDVECIELAADTDEQSRRIAEYVAKLISIYSTNPDKDKGSITPFDLLTDEHDQNYEDNRRLFLEWYHAQFRRHRIDFAPNFKRDILKNKEEYERPPRASLGVISPAAVAELKSPDAARAFYELLKTSPYEAEDYLLRIDNLSHLSSDALLALSSGMSPADLVDYLTAPPILIYDDDAAGVGDLEHMDELAAALSP